MSLKMPRVSGVHGARRISSSTRLTSPPSMRSPRPSRTRTNSYPGGYSRSAFLRYSDTAPSNLCFLNSACARRRSSALVYFRKNSMVSTCDSKGLRSFGAVASSSTSDRARVRKTSLLASSRSTSRKQTSRSAKSKGPSCLQFTTLRMINFCTPFEWDIARSCHARRTSQMRSRAFGLLRLRSILVSCASFTARKRRWQCSASAVTLPGRRSTCLSTSLSTSSTPRQLINLSRAIFTTASTTPLHSPKRSLTTSPFHLFSSLSNKLRSPNSIAACSGGNSRSTCLTSPVDCRSASSCASVLRRASSSFACILVCSSWILLSHSARNSAILIFMSACSLAARCSHSAWHSATCFEATAFCSKSRSSETFSSSILRSHCTCTS
mmetsp:Transcript_138118/g.441288  ORF Transcript_138118/g.441288 Transcript_138118/m.441288 type:complete len:381 (+) Transcript_138118:3114-4256(+)